MTIYVKTFYKKQSIDLDYIIEKAAKYTNNRLKHNYTEFNHDYIAASIVYDKKPIAFSLLQERDCFNGMGRVLTRLFYPAQMGKGLQVKNYKYSDGLRPEVYQMLDQQIEHGKRLGIENFFMSREDKKPLILKNICDGMNRNGYDWKVDIEKKYVVVNDVTQWICFTGENLLTSA